MHQRSTTFLIGAVGAGSGTPGPAVRAVEGAGAEGGALRTVDRATARLVPSRRAGVANVVGSARSVAVSTRGLVAFVQRVVYKLSNKLHAKNK